MLPFCTDILPLNYVLKTVSPRSTSAEKRSPAVRFFIDPLFCFRDRQARVWKKTAGDLLSAAFVHLLRSRRVEL